MIELYDIISLGLIIKMDDKKNENEKTMKYINTKLKDGEIPLMLHILVYNKSNTEENKLHSYIQLFIHPGCQSGVKRYIKAVYIEFIALTPLSN